MNTPATPFGLASAAVIIVMSVFWVFFPVLVLGKLGEIVKRLRAIESAAQETARNTRPAGDPKKESAVKYRIPGLND